MFPRMKQRMEEEILAEAKEQTHLMEIGARRDHAEAHGPRGRARKRLAQPARRDDQCQHRRSASSRSRMTFDAERRHRPADRDRHLCRRRALSWTARASRSACCSRSCRFGRPSPTAPSASSTSSCSSASCGCISTAWPTSSRRRPRRASTAPPLMRGRRGTCALKHVSFRYGATDPLVLEDIDLEIEPGDYVAIHGPVGRRQDHAAEAAARPQPADRRHRSSSTASAPRRSAGAPGASRSASSRRTTGCCRARIADNIALLRSRPRHAARAARGRSPRRCMPTSCARRCNI